MSYIKVSIIVLTYQSEKYINQTLLSIINQKIDFISEIIVSDDNSFDGTNSIVEKLSRIHDNVKFYKNSGQRGIINNFRNAIQHCNGEYIAYCGHDDYWHNPEKLSLQTKFLDSNLEYGLVHTDYDLLNQKTNKVVRNFNQTNKKMIANGDVSHELIYNYNICSCTPFFRKSTFDAFVPIDDFVENKFPVEDWATYVVISLFSKVGYLARSTATFRVGHTSESNSDTILKTEEYLEGHERMFNYLKSKYLDQFSSFEENSFLIYKNFSLLSASIRLGDYTNANRFAVNLQRAGLSSLKVKVSMNPILFHLYRFVRKLKR